MLLIVFRIADHHFVQHFQKMALLLRPEGQHFPFGVRQCEQAFTERKGQSRSYFQNTDSVFHQLTQMIFCLVIGGMSFEHQCGIVFDSCHESGGFCTVVFGTAGIFFLHAGLNHHADHMLPGFVKTGLLKGFPEGFHGCPEIFRLCDLYAGVRFILGTARDRDFASHNIGGMNRFRMALSARAEGFFRDRCKARASACDDLVRKTGIRIVACHLHACIDMDLGKSCQYILTDQLFRFRHCLLFVIVCEGERPEMVSAQNDMIHRQAGLIRKIFDQCHKIGRLHAGIAAILVYLVCGCLDQQGSACGCGMTHAGFQRQFVSGTGGIDPHLLSLLLQTQDFQHRIFHNLLRSAAVGKRLIIFI